MRRKKIIVDKELIQKFLNEATLMNDIFMDICLNNNIPCVQAMIECLIPDKKLSVKEVHTQKKFQSLGRAIIIDVLAIDSEGRLYDIEIQRDKRGANMKRVRLHGAIIDVNSAKKGIDFEQLPECYIIFITEHDTFGFGDVLYSIHKTIDGRNIRVDDGQHILFLNCSAKDDGSKAWKLAHDMTCSDTEEMFIPEIAETVQYNKSSELIEEEKGDLEMETLHRLVREYYKDDYDSWEREAVKREKRGEKRGEKRAITKIMKNLRDKAKMTLEEIAATLEISLDEVKSICESTTK